MPPPSPQPASTGTSTTLPAAWTCSHESRRSPPTPCDSPRRVAVPPPESENCSSTRFCPLMEDDALEKTPSAVLRGAARPSSLGPGTRRLCGHHARGPWGRTCRRRAAPSNARRSGTRTRPLAAEHPHRSGCPQICTTRARVGSEAAHRTDGRSVTIALAHARSRPPNTLPSSDVPSREDSSGAPPASSGPVMPPPRP